MKITCDSCGAKYTIADDKVSGRKVKIRCKGCGTPIVVDGAAKTAAGGTTDAGPARNDSSIPAEPAVSSLPPASSNVEWSVNLSETDQRTMTTDELVQGWKNGSVTTDAFVWKEGMGDWVPILECPELTALLNAPQAGAAAAPQQAAAVRPGSARPAATAARSGAGRVQVGTDLFAGAAASGSEAEDVNTSAPVLPQGARGDDGKPTGQRNENSVLFSLDALKAGFAAPAAKPAEPVKRGAPGRGGPATDDPFGLGGAAVAAAPMFSMADNAALLTAPAPPEPPKPVISFAADPSAPPQAQSSKKGLIIAVVAVLVVGGAGAAFALSQRRTKKKRSRRLPPRQPRPRRPAKKSARRARPKRRRARNRRKRPKRPGPRPSRQRKPATRPPPRTRAATRRKTRQPQLRARSPAPQRPPRRTKRRTQRRRRP
jgi:predicted Zn finger-like uncharacterized protein